MIVFIFLGLALEIASRQPDAHIRRRARCARYRAPRRTDGRLCVACRSSPGLSAATSTTCPLRRGPDADLHDVGSALRHDQKRWLHVGRRGFYGKEDLKDEAHRSVPGAQESDPDIGLARIYDERAEIMLSIELQIASGRRPSTGWS